MSKNNFPLKEFISDVKNDESKKNRLIIVFILFIGCVSVVVGIVNSKKNINFYTNEQEYKEQQAIDKVYEKYNQLKAQGKIKDENTVANNSDTSSSDSYSKNKDTDGDGISDYDEKYIFQTSVYLTDTDGDGISDYDEVIAGSNPSDQGSFSKVTQEISSKYSNLNKDVDMNQVRSELYNIVPDEYKEYISKMSDADILEVLSTVYNNTNSNTDNKNNNTGSGDYVAELKSKLPTFSDANLATMQNMSEAEIKQLLLDSNIASESLLSKFKEGELKSTVLNNKR